VVTALVDVWFNQPMNLVGSIDQKTNDLSKSEEDMTALKMHCESPAHDRCMGSIHWQK
jgi:hypothetical protein